MDFDLNKPIVEEILCNPGHPVTHTLIYIYTMETFIYGDLKKASLNKDISKVKTLGPYAFVLSKIISNSFEKRLRNNEQLFNKYTKSILYWGILIDKI